MAKKKTNMSIFNIVDPNLLDSLNENISPTEKELELVTSSEGEVKNIPVEYLYNYHNHTYKILDNEDMDVLVDSIKDYGIILPLLVRRIRDDQYEILSGHRRKFAAEKLGIKTVPCKIMDVDDDMADIVMADTNIARETILPSEKARTYKVRLEAAVRLGKKTEEELKSMSSDSPDSVSKIRRYMKLNDLTPLLLDKVDSGDIPVTAGVIFADLSKANLTALTNVVKKHDLSPSLKDAEKLKKAAIRPLSEEKIYDILSGKTNTKKVTRTRKIFSEDMLSDVVPAKIKKLPLDKRVEYYKKAISSYNEK